MLLTVYGTPWIVSKQFLRDVCGRRPWAARPFDLCFVDCLTAGSIVIPEDGLLPAVRESLPLAVYTAVYRHVAKRRYGPEGSAIIVANGAMDPK